MRGFGVAPSGPIGAVGEQIGYGGGYGPVMGRTVSPPSRDPPHLSACTPDGPPPYERFHSIGVDASGASPRRHPASP